MLTPVRWDLGHRKMAAQFYCSYAMAATLPVLCYVFVHKFLFNAHFDLEPDYIVRKPIVHRIQRYILRREILSTFHTRVDHRSVRHFATVNNRTKITKNAGNYARNSPLLLRHVDFYLCECLGLPHSPRQMTARSLYAFSHNDATKSPLVTMGRRKFTPKLPIPFDDHHQNLIHPYRARPHSPP